jgi:hypothetical protein
VHIWKKAKKEIAGSKRLVDVAGIEPATPAICYPPKNVTTAAGEVPSAHVWVLLSNSYGEEYLSAGGKVIGVTNLS